MEDVEYRLMAEAEDRMWWYRALHRNTRHLIRTYTPRNGREAVFLDDGCGSGGWLSKLPSCGLSLFPVGLDRSVQALTFASPKVKGPLVCGDTNSLPFAGGSIDLVLSVDVLCIKGVDPISAVSEICRVLRPGGVFIVNAPGHEWLIGAHDRQVHTARRFSRGKMRALLERNGLEVRYITHWNSLLFPIMVARRMVFPPKDGSSDIFIYPKALDLLFGMVTALEFAIMRLGVKFPFGGSVVAVACKPGRTEGTGT